MSFFEYRIPCTITDDPKDCICYVEIANCVKTVVVKRKFNLIEHLAYTIHSSICDMLKKKDCLKYKKQNISVDVTVFTQCKKPKTEMLINGVEFTYSNKVYKER